MATPVVYIFHGDDDPAIRQAIATLQSKLGETAAAEMNTTHLEAGASFDAIRSAAQATPFLTSRRLVIVNGVSKSFSAAENRARFTEFLSEVPPSTALVLVEAVALEDKHWLMKWSDSVAGLAFVRQFDLPSGPQLAAWIRERAKELGGEIQAPAAAALAQMLGNDKHGAEHELQKLLAHAGYERPVEVADVTALSLPSGEQGDFFGLIDALSAGNGAKAMQALEALMPERDLIMLFFSLVDHFRRLIQCRELGDQGVGDVDIARQLSLNPYRAKKLAAQAKRFPMTALEQIYTRLLHYDEMIKTGEMRPELAMESFVAELSAQAA